jgi:hypothetical protein
LNARIHTFFNATIAMLDLIIDLFDAMQQSLAREIEHNGTARCAYRQRQHTCVIVRDEHQTWVYTLVDLMQTQML